MPGIWLLLVLVGLGNVREAGTVSCVGVCRVTTTNRRKIHSLSQTFEMAIKLLKNLPNADNLDKKSGSCNLQITCTTAHLSAPVGDVECHSVPDTQDYLPAVQSCSMSHKYGKRGKLTNIASTAAAIIRINIRN